MHVLHYHLIRATSAAEAARQVESNIEHYGDEDNWRVIGGVASQDGKDNIDNVEEARWSLSALKEEFNDDHPGITAFELIRREIHDAVFKKTQMGYASFDSQEEALNALKAQALAIKPGDSFELYKLYTDAQALYRLTSARQQDSASEFVELCEHVYDEYGCTLWANSKELEEGEGQLYYVMTDMHT